MGAEHQVDLEILGRAVARLREGITVFEKDPDNEISRDALIKRFEFTYELSRTTLLRFLEETSSKLRISEERTLAGLVRTANQDGLLRGTWVQWRDYRSARNETSHAYNQDRARKIAAMVPDFLVEAEFMLQRMIERRRDDAGD